MLIRPMRVCPLELTLDIDSVRTILVEFLVREFKKEGFSRAVLGISGGVDSAVVAHLIVEALGRKNLLGVVLPYKTSTPQSIDDAQLVIDTLSIRSEFIDISPMVDAYCERYNVTDVRRRGNIMARMRMIVLYDLSAQERALVVGTSNRSELLTGYGTIYGDLAYALNPLGQLYKSQVWQLAEALGVPKRIIEKAPTADLWSGQTDEGDLGIQYSDLDRLLYYMVDKSTSDEKLVEMGFSQVAVKTIRARYENNKFKMRLPLIAQITDLPTN
ncbi:MAG: NAD+ synthase [Bacteroidetes bacterium]|nr:NAD+ synthase [Bacteroidota bacterium]